MPTDAPQLLTSWKEIANFFGKGVRTVQRWERMGLPVHRPTQESHSVMADPQELRLWALSSRTVSPHRAPNGGDRESDNQGRILLMRSRKESALTHAMEKHLGRELTPAEHKLLALAEEVMEHNKMQEQRSPQTAND
jgi:phage terminase Nu1 subunit (DNA packaging protein)